MAIIEIRDVLDNETGKTIFPRTHVDAVIGLEDSSYFEKVQDADDPTKFSIKLKSEYTGLWAEGWIAAGGVGTGSGGGGGASALYDLVDVSVDGRKQGDLLTYNGSHWVNMERSSLLSDYYTKSQVDTLLSNIDLDGLLTSITTQEDGTLDFTWNNGDVTKVDLTHRHLDLESAIASLRIWIDDGQGNLTLDTTKYSNLWIPGWIAAGGVGTESSGGVSFLKELTDIYHNENGILRSDGSAVQNGDVLVYDSTNAMWSAAAQSGGGGSTVSWGTESGGTIPLTVDGTTKTLLLSGALDGYLPLTGGTLTGDLRLKNTGNYGLAINFGDGNYVYLKEADDDVLSIYAKNGISLSASGASSKFEWDSDNNAWHFHGNVYADGWMAAGGIGSGSSGGSNVSISNLLSSGTRVATIKIDGTDYDILAPSGGGSGGIGTVTSVGLSVPTGLSVSGSPITTSGTLRISLANGYKIPTTAELGNFVTLDTAQTITGAKTFSTNPLTIASSSGISVNASSYIDIGEARLVYDSVANALHVTKRTGGTVSPVGLYADGFVAAGGTGSGSSGLDDTVTQNSSYPVKSSGIYSFVTARRWVGTQAQYDALGTYDSNVEYLITES